MLPFHLMPYKKLKIDVRCLKLYTMSHIWMPVAEQSFYVVSKNRWKNLARKEMLQNCFFCSQMAPQTIHGIIFTVNLSVWIMYVFISRDLFSPSVTVSLWIKFRILGRLFFLLLLGLVHHMRNLRKFHSGLAEWPGFVFDIQVKCRKSLILKTIERQLYSNVEVGLELENYYADVALPIVANIECKYSNSVQSVCSSRNLFDGQEFYSLGQVENCNEKIALEIENDVLDETEVKYGRYHWIIWPTITRIYPIFRFWWMSVSKFQENPCLLLRSISRRCLHICKYKSRVPIPFLFFFRENFSEKSWISESKVLPGTLWKWLEQMKYDKKREKELKDKIIEASIKEKIQFKTIISSQNDFWMILWI